MKFEYLHIFLKHIFFSALLLIIYLQPSFHEEEEFIMNERRNIYLPQMTSIK